MRKSRLTFSIILLSVLTSCSTIETTTSTISSENPDNKISSTTSESTKNDEIISSSTKELKQEPVISPDDLFISEFYNINYKNNVYTVANSNNNKAVELYNPSDKPLDLSKYTLKWYTNGDTNPKGQITLSGTLNPKTCYTIGNKYALDFVKENCDIETELYIGAKTALGLYKDDVLIDQFGEIGKSFITNDDYVINGVVAACDVHNVKRKDGDRASNIFVDANWIVAFDSDASTLGIHEDDVTNATNSKDTNAIEYFHQFIKDNYTNDTGYSEEKINFIKEKDNYTFEYKISYNEELIAEDGTIDYKSIKENFYGNFYLTIEITMKDKNGNILYKSNDQDIDSYGYILLVCED